MSRMSRRGGSVSNHSSIRCVALVSAKRRLARFCCTDKGCACAQTKASTQIDEGQRCLSTVLLLEQITSPQGKDVDSERRMMILAAFIVAARKTLAGDAAAFRALLAHRHGSATRRQTLIYALEHGHLQRM